MPDPLVTLIVPGRDVDVYAAAAIASLRVQADPRWRAILIDDGSVDATGEVFARAAAADPRFTVVHHDEPRGLGAARNTGLELVDTEYLGFLDADDEVTPRGIKRLLSTLQDTGSDFAVGAYVRTRLRGGLYQAGRIQPWVAASTHPERRGATIFTHPEASANIVAWSKLSRTGFWEGRCFPEGVAYEDQIVAQEMYTQGTFDVIPDVVVHWRLRADGSSISQGKGRLPVLRDYLAALRGGLDVLRAAGATDAVRHRIELILAMDLPPLDRLAAENPDPAYAAAVDDFRAQLRGHPEYASARPDQTLRAALDW